MQTMPVFDFKLDSALAIFVRYIGIAVLEMELVWPVFRLELLHRVESFKEGSQSGWCMCLRWSPKFTGSIKVSLPVA